MTKRQNFIGIQTSHTTPSPGYKQSPVRTGYEYLIPYKSNSSFTVVAEEDGVVTSITKDLLSVKYKSGREHSYKVGGTYGDIEGTTYLHELEVDVKVGEKFKKTEVLAYHKDFFEKDWLDKSKLISKTTTMATVALMANSEVYEDSSAVSREFAGDVTTTVIQERVFIMDFKQNITNLLAVGSSVHPDDILFTALDEHTDTNNLSEQSMSMLQNLSALSPRSKVHGTIDRIEMKYNGEVSDMSSTLQSLAKDLDKDIRNRTKGTNYAAKNNKVNSEYRSNGKNLQADTLELTIYIKVELALGAGDKLVFGNALKSVIGDVYEYDIETESGDKIDAMFSLQGILARVMVSPFLVGTTSRLLRHFSRQVADVYFKK